MLYDDWVNVSVELYCPIMPFGNRMHRATITCTGAQTHSVVMLSPNCKKIAQLMLKLHLSLEHLFTFQGTQLGKS